MRLQVAKGVHHLLAIGLVGSLDPEKQVAPQGQYKCMWKYKAGGCASLLLDQSENRTSALELIGGARHTTSSNQKRENESPQHIDQSDRSKPARHARHYYGPMRRGYSFDAPPSHYSFHRHHEQPPVRPYHWCSTTIDRLRPLPSTGASACLRRSY